MTRTQNTILWIIIVSILVYALQFAFHEPHLVVCTLFEDAFYYLEIAKNISEGKGATFDELHLTNGFHPLWLLILTAIWSITNISLMGMVRLLVVLQAIILFGSLYLIKRIFSGLVHPYLIGVILLLPLYPRFFHIFMVGMEGGFLIFLMLLLFYFLPRFTDGIKGDGWFVNSVLLGFLLSLIILTRLDAFFLSIVVLGYILIKGINERDWFLKYLLTAVISGVVIILLMTPFLRWNYRTFGTFATISSLMKVNWRLISLGDSFQYLFRYCVEYYIGIFMVIVGIVLIYTKKLYGSELKRRFIEPLVIFTISSISILLFYLLFVRWALFAYAFASTLPAIILGLVVVFLFIVSRFKRERDRERFIVGLFSMVVVVVFIMQVFSVSRIYRREVMRTYDSALWARDNTPEDTIFAMKDSGCFGYFSNRRTINLDGMVNDFEYQEYLRRGELEEYLHLNGVNYFVQHAFWFGDADVNTGDYEEYTLYIPSRIYREGGGTITVKKEQEVFRSEYYNPRGNEPTRVVIWKYR